MNETRIEKQLKGNKNTNWNSFWSVLGFELRRNFTSRGFIIFIGVYLFMGLFMALIIGASFDALIKEFGELNLPDQYNFFTDIEINSKTWANFFSVNMSVSIFIGQMGIIAACFYGAKMISQDLSSGGMALVSSSRVKREVNIIARYISACIIVFVLLIVSTFFSIFCMDVVAVILAKNVEFGETLGYSIVYFLRALLPIFLFTIAVTSIGVLVGVFIRNPTLAIVGSIIALVFYDSIFSSIQIFVPPEWNLEYLSFSANLANIGFWTYGTVSGSEVFFDSVPWVSLVIFIALPILSMLFSILRFRKMDI